MFTIVIYTPITHADNVRKALADTGAGAIGNYDSCSFSSRGYGRFRPLLNSNPFIGKHQEVETVEEERIETVVMADKVPQVISAVRAAHPYEEPAIHLISVFDYKSFIPSSVSINRTLPTTTPVNPVSTNLTNVTTSSTSSSSNLSLSPLSIVLEGLDGVGKSTIGKALAYRLNGKYLRTPPDSMLAYREYFSPYKSEPLTTEELALRKAYYMVGNFMAGNEMKDTVSQGVSVVMDRYYASTIAYLYGKTTGIIPNPGSIEYNWPNQLPKPKYQFVLTLPHTDRIARRAQRINEKETKEEEELRKEVTVGMNIQRIYTDCFSCIEIPLDITDNVEQSVDKILARIMEEERKDAGIK